VTTFEAILLTIVAASTPLLVAALGELVAERAGVLNLGVEGMMAMGAVCGFAGAVAFDSTIVGVMLGILVGAAMAALFALVVLGFAANQVGAGLALTIFGMSAARSSPRTSSSTRRWRSPSPSPCSSPGRGPG
jgi:simple sugar transport system permease protein